MSQGYYVLPGFVKEEDCEIARAEKLKYSGAARETSKGKWGLGAPFCAGISYYLQRAKGNGAQNDCSPR